MHGGNIPMLGLWLLGAAAATACDDGPVRPTYDYGMVDTFQVPDFPAGELGCDDLLTCTGLCQAKPDPPTCKQGCLDRGSDEALGLYQAFLNCTLAAPDGVCKAECAEPGNSKCLPCLDQACMSELAACVGQLG